MVNALALKGIVCICSLQPRRRWTGHLPPISRTARNRDAVMSVRMALAKLCACTCGGAIVGGGAVHVAENPPPRPAIVKQAKARTAHVRRVAHRRVVRRTV